MAMRDPEQRRADWRHRSRAKCRDPEKWPRYALCRIKFRAKQQGLPFNLTEDDLRIPDLCPVYKVPFVLGDQRHPNIPSVDRIRPELGYVKGNVRIISRRANLIKQDSTSGDELRLIADYMDAQAQGFVEAVMDLRQPQRAAA